MTFPGLKITGKLQPVQFLGGYGLPNKLYSFAPVSADEDQYSYQATRLNRVYLGYNFAENKIAIDVGGDNHNQVTGKLTYQRQNPFGYFQATEEIRAQDNHWQTPVSISSVNTQRQKGDLVLEGQLAFSYLPNYDVTEKHTTTYALVAGKYKINDNRAIWQWRIFGIGTDFNELSAI